MSTNTVEMDTGQHGVQILPAPRSASPVRSAALPPLREELLLHEGPRLADGSPSWTLEDPGRGAFFRIGWVEAEMLSAWQEGSAHAVAQAVMARTTLTVDATEVEQFARFLLQQHLVRLQGEQALAQLQEQAERTRRHASWYQQALRHYLFIRIPLCRPDGFLTRTLPWVRRVFLNAGFLWLTLLAGVLGLVLALRQWDEFLHTFPYFFTLEGAALAGLTLVLAKVVHELGHAYVCKHYGCRVSTMGVALMVLWPVLYTDTSGAWRLPGRRPRMMIGASGMLAETALAAWATLAWSFLPDGMLRSAMFVLATTTWILTLAVNLNPFMRFDGYFLMSDALAVPNLQQRSFALARWRLREWLFGFGDVAPEVFEPWRERVLTVYAWCVWIYRFFLFLGIALLVYHMAFKVLGIILFLVEIVAFILKPVWTEMREWGKRRQDLHWNRRTVTVVALLLALLLLAVVPWRTAVHAPALSRAAGQFQIYAPVGAQLAQLEIRPGQQVVQGAPLLALEAPALRHELDNVARRLAQLRWQSSFHPLTSDTRAQAPVARQELSAVQLRLAVLQQQVQQLTVAAPFDGVVVDMAEPLGVGEWLEAGEWLATIVVPGERLLEAYVAEQDVAYLREGDAAWFYPTDPAQPAVQAEVVTIAQTASHDLGAVPELASVHGGAIAASKDGQRLAPEQAVYRVVLRLAALPESAQVMMTGQEPAGQYAIAPVLVGSVAIEGEARSWAASVWRQAVAVFVREMGF